MSDIDAEEDIPETTNANPNKLETKRIFINHVDTYNGKNLARVI